MILFLVGLISGIISGMGIGGGAILIPALTVVADLEQHLAQGTNLLFFIPTAIVALITHIKNKRINFKLSIPLIIFGLLGVYAGSRIAIAAPGNLLRKFFGAFLFLSGIYEALRRGKER